MEMVLLKRSQRRIGSVVKVLMKKWQDVTLESKRTFYAKIF